MRVFSCGLGSVVRPRREATALFFLWLRRGLSVPSHPPRACSPLQLLPAQPAGQRHLQSRTINPIPSSRFNFLRIWTPISQSLPSFAFASAAAASPPTFDAPQDGNMAYSLPPLPYDRTALQPHISAETLDYHHGKHHNAYVVKLNALIIGSKFEGKSGERTTLEELIKKSDGAIFNQAAQIWNHTFYWHSMGPGCGGTPTGKIAEMIDETYGNFDKFKEQFSAAAAGHFGSGWVWLVLNKDKKLEIVQTHDAGNPLKDDIGMPLLTCDVWEHAYYIDRKNDRAAYVKAWWSLANWEFANKNLLAAF